MFFFFQKKLSAFTKLLQQSVVEKKPSAFHNLLQRKVHISRLFEVLSVDKIRKKTCSFFCEKS
jgi:hypothetical protein